MKFDKMPCIIYTDIELIRKIDRCESSLQIFNVINLVFDHIED